MALLAKLRVVTTARIEIKHPSRPLQILHTYDARSRLSEEEECLFAGPDSGREVRVIVRPRTDVISAVVLNDVRLLLSGVKTLRQAHEEREQRLTLWPAEDPPIDGTQAILNGKFQDLLDEAKRVARTNVIVLISGESGTGKEILARAIHQHSSRADKPFVPFNCTAVPRDLLESQLFGYRRGAFTGADRDSQGLIRRASHGTLFLDEIGELSLDLQPKLLRFLESGEIAPLGDTGAMHVDVRIVAATNAKLDQLVEEKRFRDDLFYRINVVRLDIPPLRERRDEIPALVQHFVAAAAQEFEKGNVRVAEETMEYLLLHKWPGNVRQLQNELSAMVALAEPDSVLTPSALSPAVRQATPGPLRTVSRGQSDTELTVQLTGTLAPTIERIEREMILAALRAHPGRKDAAAKSLGISRKGLYLKRQRLGI